MIRYRKLSSFSQCLLKGSQNARVTLASIEGGGSEACVAGGLLLRLPHLSSPRPIHPNPSTDVQKHEQFNDVREFEKQYSSPSIIKQSHENLDIQKSAHLPHS